MILDIPRDKTYPPGAVQCNRCGGHGCLLCAGRGWFAGPDHPHGRRCEHAGCRKPLPLDPAASRISARPAPSPR
jgi:hypothetical protein